GIQLEAVVSEAGLKTFGYLVGKRALVGGHIKEGHLAGGERIRHFGDDGVAKLAFEIGNAIDIASTADFRVERFRVFQMIGINAETAKADGAELLVANGDGILRAPVLIGLDARGKKIDIGLEGRLEGFIPILEI